MRGINPQRYRRRDEPQGSEELKNCVTDKLARSDLRLIVVSFGNKSKSRKLVAEWQTFNSQGERLESE